MRIHPPDFSILPPFFLNHSTDSFSTAEFHLYVNEGKRSHLEASPTFLPFHSPMPPPSTPTAPDQYAHKKGRHDCWCIVSITWSFSVTRFSLVHTQMYVGTVPSHTVPAIALLTFGPRSSGLIGLLTTALFDGTRLFTYSKAK